MATVQLPKPPRVVLQGVDWRTYTRLVYALAEHRVRLTYDRGVLEIMSPLPVHEWGAHLLGRFIEVLTEELGQPLVAGGSTTLRLRPKRRGLEPDRCYWLVNEARIRGKDRLDLRVDPPPDLAVEVNAIHSSLNRMGIYESLRVPEVWRLDDQGLTFHVLGPHGKYAPSSHSLAFPQVTPADLMRFLALRPQLDDNSIVRQFRAWVQQHVVPPTP